MKLYHRIGISFINILILGGALVFIYLQAIPVDEWALFSVDTTTILLIVIILYAIVNVFVSLCLTYMQQHSLLAQFVKSFVMTILVIALFDYILFPVLWIFGYSFEGDLVRNTLIIASLIRLFIRIWLGRRWGGDSKNE